jgi:hypothetical protein
MGRDRGSVSSRRRVVGLAIWFFPLLLVAAVGFLWQAPPLAQPSPAVAPPLEEATLQPLDPAVQATLSGVRLNRRTGTYFASLAIRNLSTAPVAGPL